MTPGVMTAHQLLLKWGTDLKAAREARDWSLRMLQVATGSMVAASCISQMERGMRVPTDYEWQKLVAVMPELAPEPAPEPQVEPTARLTDPQQSHEVVASISRDATVADRILWLAERWSPEPFSDTDLVAAFQKFWPRPLHQPWQRNVIARARGLLHTHRVLDATGKAQTIQDPHAPIIPAGTWKPAGGLHALTHYIWNLEVHSHDII